ncbi:MAG: hypothetical protein JNL74_17085, partial [Fibrobacteres bacterium]|nr:hypothetical protein [Fibrobacterota bacterium]
QENHTTNGWLWAASMGVLATLMSLVVLRQIKEKQNYLEREVAVRTAELRLSTSALEMANRNLEETITKALEIVARADEDECKAGINEVSRILNRNKEE